MVEKNVEKSEKMSLPLCEITAPLLKQRGKKVEKMSVPLFRFTDVIG